VMNEFQKCFDFQKLQEINGILSRDTSYCMERCRTLYQEKKELEPYWARALVQSFFLWVDEMNYYLKHRLQKAQQLGILYLKPEEINALMEKSYELDHQGIPLSRPKFIATDRQFCFVFNLLIRLFELKIELSLEEEGWQCFELALQIRHRLTHARHPQVLLLSVAEVELVGKAVSWYTKNQQKVLQNLLNQFHQSSFIKKLSHSLKQQRGEFPEDSTGSTASSS
jgi:hypothetical protein